MECNLMSKSEKEEAWSEYAKAVTSSSQMGPPFFLGTGEMQKIYSGEAVFQRWLDVEAALAKAEAEVGLIPKEAAAEIAKKAKLEYIDPIAIRDKCRTTDHPVVSMIWSLKSVCEKDYGQYIHWGATTQDIYETAFGLAHKEIFPIFMRDLKAMLKSCLDLAEKHKFTVMAGRTHSQQGVPVTFGYKAAIWAVELSRSIQRMEEMQPRVLTGSMTGVAGTFAAMAPMAEKGPQIQELMMKQLGLGTAPICSFASRDVRAEHANNLAIIAGTIGKIANEVFQLGRTEIKELEEPIPPGTVGSSTMPGKRNPATCEEMITMAYQAKRISGISLDGMMVNNERDMGWPTSDSGVQMLNMIVGLMLNWACWLLEGLVVNADRMRANINEMLMTESLMIKLAVKAGRQTAHELVTDAAKERTSKGVSLKEAVLGNKEITQHMNEDEIEKALDPVNYIGAIPQVVDNVIKELTPLTK